MEVLFTFETMYSAFLAGVLGWTFAHTFMMRKRLNKVESLLSQAGE
jgi:cytosine/uracil/thiamine/allantoin permease